MNIIKTDVLDVYILEPQVFGDKRGWFMESWSKRKMEEAGLFYDFIQDNQSFSASKHTLRGLHFQKGQHTQAKIVRCTQGAVLDVAVDIRKGSPTYKKWVAIELSEENKRQLLIPRGFAHGFLVLSEEAEFTYKCDDTYNCAAEGGLAWNDPDVSIAWPMEHIKKEELLTSEKDSKWPSLKELKETDLFANLK